MEVLRKKFSFSCYLQIDKRINNVENTRTKTNSNYNQGINVRINTKDVRKEDRLCMKTSPKEA